MLADRGILEPYDGASAGPGRPRRFWVAPDIITQIQDVGGNV
jgi:hypothetical protein